MLVDKRSLSYERGTFVSLVMIQTLNPYLGCALCRGVDEPAHALGWVHQLLLFSPHKTTNPPHGLLRKKASVRSQKVPKLIVHLSAISGDKELESMGG